VSELREKIADALIPWLTHDRRKRMQATDAVLRVLAEHGDTEQVREQVRAVAERQLSDQASGGDDKRGWVYAHDLLAILDAPTQPAERAEQQAELAKQWQSEYDEQTAHAARLSRELAAARQQLDQVRATVLALPYGQTGGTKWLPDFEIGWLHCRQDVLNILNTPARPTGHDETGQ
jgi:hypothetical protein